MWAGSIQSKEFFLDQAGASVKRHLLTYIDKRGAFVNIKPGDVELKEDGFVAGERRDYWGTFLGADFQREGRSFKLSNNCAFASFSRENIITLKTIKEEKWISVEGLFDKIQALQEDGYRRQVFSGAEIEGIEELLASFSQGHGRPTTCSYITLKNPNGNKNLSMNKIILMNNALVSIDECIKHTKEALNNNNSDVPYTTVLEQCLSRIKKILQDTQRRNALISTEASADKYTSRAEEALETAINTVTREWGSVEGECKPQSSNNFQATLFAPVGERARSDNNALDVSDNNEAFRATSLQG
ncbi:MAG: hypothetical protein COB66_03105 [Coxiella sp. (in: Bacteria)]|nr:MAG: hypothetical protein COB66_03105 [Coxiella sp. (in: g-proteobacteria)]